jgi:hypothetical protein
MNFIRPKIKIFYRAGLTFEDRRSVKGKFINTIVPGLYIRAINIFFRVFPFRKGCL